MTRKLTLVSMPAERSERKSRKAALAQQEQAVRDAAEKRETLARLQAVIHESDAAARSAAQAARLANDARTAWVRGGCTYSAARELQALEDAAAQAAGVAERAAVNAKAVRRELAAAADAVESATFTADMSVRAIADAIGAILATEAAPLFDRFERAATEYRDLRHQVTALFQVLDPPTPSLNSGWNGAPASTRYKAASSAAAAQLVAAVERRATITTLEKERSAGGDQVFDEMLERLAAPWLARAAALRADPES
jgi:hypothetical protein